MITLLAGIISLPNMMYFSSEEYQPTQYTKNFARLVQGSAICNYTTWVPCPNCNCSNSDEWEDPTRCGIVDLANKDGEFGAAENNNNMTFALRNNCIAPTITIGMVNYATMILTLLSTIGLAEFLRRSEVYFDEDEQTAQDYSIVITNPPPDAKYPDEWRKFFEDTFNAKVTVCTCALDNDILVRTLRERREKLQMIANMLPPGSSMNLLRIAKIAAKEEQERNTLGSLMAMLSPGIPEHFSRVVALNAKVQGLAQLTYPCTNVFVTFEREADQRNVLSSLSVGYFATARNKKTALKNPNHLFRGEHVLAVSEPEEPNSKFQCVFLQGCVCSWGCFVVNLFVLFCEDT